MLCFGAMRVINKISHFLRNTAMKIQEYFCKNLPTFQLSGVRDETDEHKFLIMS